MTYKKNLAEKLGLKKKKKKRKDEWMRTALIHELPGVRVSVPQIAAPVGGALFFVAARENAARNFARKRALKRRRKRPS